MKSLATPVIISFIMLMSGLPRASAMKGHIMHGHRHDQTGDAHGGQQPIVGTHVYMYAVSTNGFGAAPVSLLHGQGVSFDAAGNGFVMTNGGGGFDLTGLYAAYCPTPNSFVYLQAIGGNPGNGSNNPAIDLISALPWACSQLPNAPNVNVNEQTTVAAAWTLDRYATVSSSSLSAGPGNAQGLLNAYNYANNLVSGFTATVGTSAYGGALTVPVTTINAMANSIAACVNDGASSTACTQLFAAATPPGGIAPVDTFQAALNIALNPSQNVAQIFNLGGPIPAFEPTLANPPSTWSITYGIAASQFQMGSITIDHTKVQNSDQMDFPVLISSSNSVPALATTQYGGSVMNSSGFDVIFTSDAAGKNILDHEIDTYNPANGMAAFWVRLPVLSHSSDTTIYVWYGNPNIASTLENTVGVWSNNYLSVYHLGNNGAIGLNDSAVAGYTLSGQAAPVTGQIGGAVYLSVPGQFLYYNSVPLYPSGSSPLTFELWEQHALNGQLVGYGNFSDPNGVASLYDYGAGFAFGLGQGVLGDYLVYSGPRDQNWHQMVGVYSGGDIAPPSAVQYYDGAPVPAGQGYIDGTPNVQNQEFMIGGYWDPTGAIDEVRVSAGTRSADWIATEFANQFSPSTFSNFGQVGINNSTVILSANPATAVSGSSITFAANVYPNSATGNVTFSTNNAAQIGSGPLVNGIATIVTSSLPIGSYSVTAMYGGDATDTAANSTPLMVTITGQGNSLAITNIVPSLANVGTIVTLQGVGFGNTPSSIMFNARFVPPLIWTDTLVSFQVPAGAATGLVQIARGGSQSNGVLLTMSSSPPPCPVH